MPQDDLTTDESRWPIVVHTTIGIPSDAQLDAFMRRADEILARRQPYVVVFDNSQGGRATSYMRERTKEWLKARGPELSQHCLGTALVIRSAALRFVLSTVMFVWPAPVPAEVFGTLEEALAWARSKLDTRQRRAL